MPVKYDCILPDSFENEANDLHFSPADTIRIAFTAGKGDVTRVVTRPRVVSLCVASL